MENEGYWIASELKKWPSKSKLVDILTAAGLTIDIRSMSIWVDDCESWVFESLDSTSATVAADTDTLERAIKDSNRISKALGLARIRHRFEVYACEPSNGELLYYTHHDWPYLGEI